MPTNFLKKIREERGMSARALALKIDVSPQLISNFENNRSNISQEVAKKITDELGITHEYLMSGVSRENRTLTKTTMAKAIKMVAQYYEKQGIDNDALITISTELYLQLLDLEASRNDNSLREFFKHTREKLAVGLAAKCLLDDPEIKIDYEKNKS